MKLDQHKIDKKIIILLIFLSLICQSPIFLNFGPLKGNFYFIFGLLYLVYKTIHRYRPYKFIYFPFIIFLLFYIIGELYWLQPKFLFFPLYFILSWYVVISLKKDELLLFANISTKVVIFFIFLSVLGFIYAFLGGSEIFNIINEDQRINHFYLTTFSNDIFGNIIRPSAIYDEPGAFSFIICFIAGLRHILKMRMKESWVMLIFGLFTFSLTHFIFLVLFLFQDMKNWKLKQVLYFFGILFVSLIIFLNSYIGQIFNDLILKRLTIQDGKFAGDNRSGRVETSLNYLRSLKVFFFGLDIDCVVNPKACYEKNYDAFGDNPLGPLVLTGITLSISYYMILYFLLINFIKKFNFVYLGLALILFQRIEVMSYAYALLIAIPVYSIYYVKTYRIDV
jgi:hypothetical protein